eukprot:IDg15303t1
MMPLPIGIDTAPFLIMKLGIPKAAATVSLAILSYSMNNDRSKMKLWVAPESMRYWWLLFMSIIARVLRYISKIVENPPFPPGLSNP